jgi:hypothetical protein
VLRPLLPAQFVVLIPIHEIVQTDP